MRGSNVKNIILFVVGLVTIAEAFDLVDVKSKYQFNKNFLLVKVKNSLKLGNFCYSFFYLQA